MGASNVTIACYKIGMTEEEKIPIHYYCKSGSNLEEYLTFLSLLLDKKEMREDTLNKTGKPRDLNLAVWLTLNDIGRLYMDHKAKYLGNMLVKISAKVEKFHVETGRHTRLSYIPYMYAPQMSDHHGHIDTFNSYVRNFNKTALASATYDINTLLMRVPKTGEATNVRIKGEAFISSDACWRIQGNMVTHLSNYKMTEVLSDIRQFLDDDFKTDSATPTLEREPKVQWGETPLPKRSRLRDRDEEDQEPGSSNQTTHAPAQFAAIVQQERQLEKRPATTFPRFGKFQRPSQREMERRAKREAQQEEARDVAIQKSEVDDSIDPKWKAFLVTDD